MSDKREEIQEDQEDLEEFKATGEPSSVPDPGTKKTPKRKGDKDQGEDEPHLQGSSKKPNGKSKPSMMSDAVKMMGQMTEEELQELLNKLAGDDEDDDEEEVSEKVELKKITTDDVDVSDDVNAMFKDDEELTEDFKEKATNIFEHAVVAKVNEILENAYVDAYSDKEALEESVSTELSEKLDEYLDYVASEWFKENSLAIDKGIYADLTESFMSGLKSLFEEHYVSIPEEKVEVVDELVEKNEELEENLNVLIESNSELFKKVKEFEMEDVIESLSEDLTETQTDKLRSLAEGISFKDSDDYRNKVSILKENYFGDGDNTDNTVTLTEDEEIPVDEEEEEARPDMSPYVSAISRHARASKK